jgi:hypothetical protein
MTATSPTTAEYMASPNTVPSAANGSITRIAISAKGRRRWCSYSTSAEIWTTGIPR